MSNVRIVSREEVSNELIYYNLDVVSSSDTDFGSNSNPPVRFEETRSTPILSDASQYNFSIVRFTINGANKDLPLFIPIMKAVQGITGGITINSGNNNIQLFITVGGNAFTFNVNIANGTYTDLPTLLAAINTALVGFVGQMDPSSFIIASARAFFDTANILNINIILEPTPGGGAFTLLTLQGNAITSGILGFTAAQSSRSGNTIFNGVNPINIVPPPNAYQTIYSITLAGRIGSGPVQRVTQPILWFPETSDTNRPLTDAGGNLRQDFSNKYWWCYSYKHWIDCVNRAFTDATVALGTALGGALTTLAPVMTYDAGSGLFTISFDSNGYGNNLNSYLQALGQSTVVSPINQDQRLRFSTNDEQISLFFNSNTMGLFNNFNNIYYGIESATASNGQDNLIVVTNERTASFNPLTTSGTPAGSIAVIVPSSTTQPTLYPRALFVITQDYPSTSSLWSPCASIVFCSTLLPALPENTQVPLKVGVGNNTGQNTSSNAFAPIITDIALPMGSGSDYRQFISYTPTAEYRLTSLGTSKVDIREINLQVFWKCRYTSELIPMTLFNQSSVSVKILFRKKMGGV